MLVLGWFLFPFGRTQACHFFEVAIKSASGGETAFFGSFRDAHLRMFLHQLLCMADSVAVDHIGEILSGKTLDDSADIGPVGRQAGGNIRNAKVRLFEKLLFLNNLRELFR